MTTRRVTGPTWPRPCPPSSPATGWGGSTPARSPSTRPRRSCSLWRSSMSRSSTQSSTWSAVILIRFGVFFFKLAFVEIILGERDRVDQLCSRGLSHGRREASTTFRNSHYERGDVSSFRWIFIDKQISRSLYIRKRSFIIIISYSAFFQKPIQCLIPGALFEV